MTMWGRLMDVFWQQRQAEPETVRARELARSISAKADSLQETLQKYNRSRDPFAAMMADMYNRDQLSRMHLGPPK